MKKVKLLLTSLVAMITITSLSLSTTTYAWNGNKDGTGTHANIANQAVQMLNTDLNTTEPQIIKNNLTILNQNLDQLKLGSCFPDYDPNGFDMYEDHFWDPDTGHNYTYSAAWYTGGKIDLTADTNVSKFTALAIEDWKKGIYGTAAFELGEALHFTGDLNCPYHAANITAVDSIGHVEYESYADTDGLKYLLSTMNCTTKDAIYANTITSVPLSTWITNTDTYYGKIAKNLYYTKSTMSNSWNDWDFSISQALPDAQKNCALLIYRFLNEVSGTVPAVNTTNFNKLQLVIKTANVTYAGTDDYVYFGFQTKDGRTFEFPLDNPGNDFEQNQIDTYVLSLPATVDYKSITNTWLRKANYTIFGDDWNPQYIKVIINGYVKQDVTINTWLSGNTTYKMTFSQ